MEAPKLCKIYRNNELLKIFYCKTVDCTGGILIFYGVPLKSGHGETDIYFFGDIFHEVDYEEKRAFILLSDGGINIRITW